MAFPNWPKHLLIILTKSLQNIIIIISLLNVFSIDIILKIYILEKNWFPNMLFSACIRYITALEGGCGKSEFSFSSKETGRNGKHYHENVEKIQSNLTTQIFD